MSHERRYVSNPTRWVATCPITNKRSYIDKKAAKAANKRIPGDNMNVYKCSDTTHGEHYHIGHLPKMVKMGDASRDSLRTYNF